MTDTDTRSDFEREALPWLGDVARFARSLTRDAAAADDLTQETYLQAMRGWHTFQPGTNCRSWLFTICRRAWIRMARRAGREEVCDAPEIEARAAERVFMSAAEAGVMTFDDEDLRSALDRALAELTEPLRAAVLLVDLHEHSYEAAAQVLEIPVGTVRSRLFRGRRLLQEQLVAVARERGLAAMPVHGKGMPMMSERTEDCEGVMRQLWDFLDGELTAERMAAIEAHVRMCGRCGPLFAFERAFLKMLSASGPMTAEESQLRERVIKAIRAAAPALER